MFSSSLLNLVAEALMPQQIPLWVDRMAIVWMAGIAAETLQNRPAQGGAGDRGSNPRDFRN